MAGMGTKDMGRMNKIASYTAASVFPVKLLKGGITSNGKIMPRHVQLNPTNKCNLKCSFCSCSERDKDLTMDTREIIEMMGMFWRFGCSAVTITGGGEPLLHPEIDQIIQHLVKGLNLEVGLVSNGIALDVLNDRVGDLLTWVRISLADEREIPEQQLMRAFKRMTDVDWAFSYVLSSKFNLEQITRAIQLANEYNLTHVRIVSNLLDTEHVDMGELESQLASLEIDLSKVIFQGRKRWRAGQQKCYISLLKPVVDAKGDVYPCCGTQYAMDPPDLNYGENMKMCNWKDFEKVYLNQIEFDGSKCSRCYYGEYNTLLELIRTPVEHGAFV